jgi:hypothetical protein
MLYLICLFPCIYLFTAKVKTRKYDDLEQQVRHLQSVVNASTALSTSQNDSSSTTAGLLEQAPDGPRLFLSEAMSFSEHAPPPIPTSLHGGVGLPESAHPGSASYQTETFSGSPYQSSISFQAGATEPSLLEPRSSALPRNQIVDQSVGSNCRTQGLAAISQHQIDGMGPTTYSTFQQTYMAGQPRSIGSVHLTSDQICRLFKV